MAEQVMKMSDHALQPERAMNEDTLIRRLEANDPEALRELYRQYRERVFAVVRKNVKDEWDAEEVTQDVLWKVYTKIDSFRRNSALWSWMYRIAVNEARMKTRKYKRHPIPMEDDTLKAIIHDEDADEQKTPDEEVELKDVLEEVEEYLAESTDENTKVFVDLEFGGETKKTVANELGLTVPAVKARLHRMRVGLRDRIRQNYLQAS